ncbi:imelysin family protein [Parendozoicomonas sp. Alg238-R29]|uniref:imelysin family protein n=1 Tax=Parendozoicomonas sp. Alg238-R29 TaxID=2993446 RepID=UPI00248EAE80|nr:imelysin family protein [Parendozoicomonas sp. Alg238-R29]
MIRCSFPKKIAATITTMLMLAGCQPAEQEPEVKLAISTANVVKPLYDSLSQNLSLLSDHAESYCKSPSSFGLVEVQESWKAAMGSWQAASIINFGPVTLGSMAWKFQFWPDRKNLIRKKIESAVEIANKGKKQWTDANIAKASVVARGLGGVEYLVFDSEVSSLAGEPVRCQYLLAVIGDMQRNAKRLSRGWQEGEQRYPEELKAMAQQGYEGAEELYQVSGLLVSSLYASLETSIRKLKMPYGKDDAQSGNAYLAESWRSQTSLDHLRTTLSSSYQLYLAGEEYGLDDRLSGVDDEGRAIAKEVKTAFHNAESIVNSETLKNTTLTESVKDSDKREKIAQLIDSLTNLKNLVGSQVPDKLGIPLGFNSNDGD